MSQYLKVFTLTLILLSALCVLPTEAAAPNGGLALPYLAVGGAQSGWHFVTLLYMSNPTSASNAGMIEVFGNDVEPLPVELNGGAELVAEVPWTLSPGESAQLVLTHPGEVLHSGWLRVKPSETPDVDLIVVLQFYNGDFLAAEEGILVLSGKTRSLPYNLVALRGMRSALPQFLWEFDQRSGLVELLRPAERATPMLPPDGSQRMENAVVRRPSPLHIFLRKLDTKMGLVPARSAGRTTQTRWRLWRPAIASSRATARSAATRAV